jgi:hypothetical protein
MDDLDRSETPGTAGRGVSEALTRAAGRVIFKNFGPSVKEIMDEVLPTAQSLLDRQAKEIAEAIEEQADDLDIGKMPWGDAWRAHQYFKGKLHEMAAIAYARGGDQ